jgi:hypothetical protein
MTAYTVTTNAGRVRIAAEDKTSAAVEAVKLLVRTAKGYNAKFAAQGLPTWAQRSENHADYTVTGVRKVATR